MLDKTKLQSKDIYLETNSKVEFVILLLKIGGVRLIKKSRITNRIMRKMSGNPAWRLMRSIDSNERTGATSSGLFYTERGKT